MNPFESGARKNIPAVLIYARYEDRVLMIHRDAPERAKTDYHAGKWNGWAERSRLDESAWKRLRASSRKRPAWRFPLRVSSRWAYCSFRISRRIKTRIGRCSFSRSSSPIPKQEECRLEFRGRLAALDSRKGSAGVESLARGSVLHPACRGKSPVSWNDLVPRRRGDPSGCARAIGRVEQSLLLSLA